MPFVNIKMVKSDKGPEAKKQLIKGVTKLLQDIYGKPPEFCHVVIEEIEPDSWGLGGQSVAERRG